MSEYRPIKTISQIAAALSVSDARAVELLKMLERLGIAEEHGPGYRATLHAWAFYPRPPKWTEKAEKAA